MSETTDAQWFGLRYVVAGRMLDLTAPIAIELYLTADRTNYRADYDSREMLRRVRDYLARQRHISFLAGRHFARQVPK